MPKNPFKDLLNQMKGMGPEAIQKKNQQDEQEDKYLQWLMTQPRAYRREFERKYGIKVPSGNKPIINTNKKK